MSGAVLCAFWCEESGVWRLPFAWLAKSRTQGIIREWFAMTSSMAVDKKEKEYMQILNSLLKSHQIAVHGVGLGIFCGSSSYGILGFPSHLLMLCQADLMSLDPVSSQSIAETARRGASLWSTGTTKHQKSIKIAWWLTWYYERYSQGKIWQDIFKRVGTVGTAIRIARSLRCRGGRMCKSRKRLDR